MNHKVEEELIQNEHYNHMNYPNLRIVLEEIFLFLLNKQRKDKPQETRSAIEIALIRRG